MADETSRADEVATVVDIINDTKIGMFSTLDAGGTIVSRPLVAQEVEVDGDVWFFTHQDTSQVTQVRANPRVNVTFGNRKEWVSLSGRASVVVDEEKFRDLWDQAVAAWFPDGPETPGLVLLRVEAESAEYWDTPGGTVATIAQFVKARVTGDQIDAGESHTVDL